MAINQLYRKNVLIVLVATLSLISCEEKTKEQVNFVTDGLTVRIDVPMGDLIQDNPMPMIGNLAHFVDNNRDSVEIFILSPRIEKNKLVSINTVGAMIYSDNGKIKELIVAVPSAREKQSLDISSLMDLSVHHGNVKRMIEQWYDGFLPKGSTKVMRWENAKYINEKFEANKIN